MGNIISYLQWRGDLPFAVKPFNEVDNLVLSYLSYFDFKEIVPGIGEKEGITVKEAAEKYKLTGRQDMAFEDVNFLWELGKSDRFKDAVLWGYEDVVDTAEEMTQFAAIHISLSDGTEYVAFRGTDSTIVGWQEDFHLGFEVTSAQRRAADYLNWTIDPDRDILYRIGGHSKGGNLAAYGAMMCQEPVRKQIVEIYMNDSPGICPEIMQKDRYWQIDSKIIRIVPEFSIIGMLFGKDAPKKIVKSSAEGVLQHDAVSWQVEGDHFLTAGGLSSKSQIYNDIFERWIESADTEQKRTFTDDFFGALGAGGAKTMVEVAKGGAAGFESILYAMAVSDRDSKKAVGKLLKSFWVEARQIDYKRLFCQKKMVQGITALLIGGLFVIAPEMALNMIGTAVFLWLLVFSVLRIGSLVKEKDNWRTEEKVKIIFYSVIAVVEMLCILFNNIVVISTNLILGLFFGWRAYHQGKKAASKKANGSRLWGLYTAEAVLACILAVVIFAKSGQGMKDYILTAGTYLTIIGMIRIGREWFAAAKNNK